ncbi:hypothetical protein [Streptomyces sp. NPDC054765]
MNEPRGAMMRKDTCVPRIPVLRLCRTSLAALIVTLAFLLGGAATATGAAKAAFSVPSSAKSVSAPPAAKPDNDTSEEKAKREAERGQPRRTARTSVGIPQHTGRPHPPCSGSTTAPDTTAPSRAPAPGSRAKAASRPAALPVLHCVFRC